MTNRNTAFHKIKNFDQTDEPDYQELTKIGLTKLAAACYEVLLKQPYSTTQEVSGLLRKPYRSIQRCLNDLQAKGFIRKIYTGYNPSKYDAILLYKALAEYALWQCQQIEQLIQAQKIQQYEKELEKMKR